jgi:hypothetical protein
LLTIYAALLLILIVGVGIQKRWATPQWGPLSEWVAGLLTLGAVSVAILAAIIAQREAAEGQRRRLVDHELQRRRENLHALHETWAGIAKIALLFPIFTDYLLNLPERFNPNIPRTDSVPPDKPDNPLAYDLGDRFGGFLDAWMQMIEPPLFLTLALLQDTPLEAPVRRLNEQLTEIKEVELPALMRATSFEFRRPDVGPIDEKWKNITRQRNEHLALTRQHLSLNLDDIEAYLDTQAAQREP